MVGVPAAMVATLLIGPGARITTTVRLLADSGTALR
jgi:CRISPR-associated protein Cas1